MHKIKGAQRPGRRKKKSTLDRTQTNTHHLHQQPLRAYLIGPLCTTIATSTPIRPLQHQQQPQPTIDQRTTRPVVRSNHPCPSNSLHMSPIVRARGCTSRALFMFVSLLESHSLSQSCPFLLLLLFSCSFLCSCTSVLLSFSSHSSFSSPIEIDHHFHFFLFFLVHTPCPSSYPFLSLSIYLSASLSLSQSLFCQHDLVQRALLLCFAKKGC